MRLTPVDRVPNYERRERHNLQAILEEFVKSPYIIVKVNFTDKDYKSPNIAATCMYRAIQKSGHPLRVIRRKDDVYLARVSKEKES